MGVFDADVRPRPVVCLPKPPRASRPPVHILRGQAGGRRLITGSAAEVGFATLSSTVFGGGGAISLVPTRLLREPRPASVLGVAYGGGGPRDCVNTRAKTPEALRECRCCPDLAVGQSRSVGRCGQ